MNSKAAIFWLVLSLALGAGLVVQWKRGERKQALVEKLQLEVEQVHQKANAASARAQEMEKEQLKLRGEARAAEAELNSTRLAYSAFMQMTNAPQGAQRRPQVVQPQADGSASMGNMIGTMLKDPEMRKAMEQQQRMGLDMVYGSLMKQLQLTPEQEKKFKDILLEQQMQNMAQAWTLFDPNNRTESAQQMAEQQKKTQEKLKGLIGEEKYAQYEDYNQTASERMMLEQFGRQAEISPEQNEQLLAIIREEKKNVQINRGPDAFDPARDWQKLIDSGEASEKIFAQQEEVNSRVLDRAGQVLTPEQIQKLGPLLKNQLEMQKNNMKMARQMFGGSNPPPLPPQSPPRPLAPVE